MATKKKQQNRRFVRNLRYISLRLPFLQKPLNPRGQPGDIQALRSDYEEDEVFILNENNTFEVLNEEQAHEVWQKQGINAQGGRTNPTISELRSETGKSYDQDQVRVRNMEETKFKVADVQRDDKGTTNVVRPEDRQNDVNPRTEASPGSQQNPVEDKRNEEEKAADLVDNLRSTVKQGQGAQGSK